MLILIELFLETQDGHLWVDEEEIKSWHIKLAKVKLHPYQGHLFYPLSELKTLSYTLNKKNLSIEIKIPLNLFSESEISGYSVENIKPEPAHWGGFVNYDFNGQSTPSSRQVNALLEAGIFNQHGVLTNTELASVAGNVHKEIRLNTTWTKDIPETMHTFRFGDTFTNPGAWGQSVGYGGLQ
jgi:outer membrane usher protein